MDPPESSILGHEITSHPGNLLGEVFDLNWVVPGYELLVASGFRGLIDLLFKLLSLNKDHGLVAIENLGVHGVVEVSNLLETNTFFVELLSLFSNLDDLRINFGGKTMLTHSSCVFDQGDKLIIIVDLQECSRVASCNMIKLHQLSIHLVDMSSGLILEGL